MTDLVILQTCAPDYRKKVYDQIYDNLGRRFILLAGNQYFETSVKTNYSSSCLQTVKNHFVFGRRVLFQTGMWNKVISSKVVVLEMNPRIISNWMILIVRRVLGKRTVLWGHAWPRRGAGSKSDKLRHIMRVLANEIIVYTYSQAKDLRVKMPSKPIKVAPNAVMFQSEMNGARAFNEKRNDFIYVGRLTPLKKARFLVDSFIKYHSKFNEECRLLVVGDGEELKGIKEVIANASMEKRIITYGHISNHAQLVDLYAKSICSLSPGYVGLSVTQSLGMGVPMLISKEENHSPEIEAVQVGFNGQFFETDDSLSLINEMLDFYKKQEFWDSKCEQIVNDCKDKYSVENMAETFIGLIN